MFLSFPKILMKYIVIIMDEKWNLIGYMVPSKSGLQFFLWNMKKKNFINLGMFYRYISKNLICSTLI